MLTKTCKRISMNHEDFSSNISSRRAYQQRRYSILNTEPRQRLKSSSSIDANQILKANKSTTVVVKIPAVLVAKELSDIVVYTQAIKFRGLFACSRKDQADRQHLLVPSIYFSLATDLAEFWEVSLLFPNSRFELFIDGCWNSQWKADTESSKT